MLFKTTAPSAFVLSIHAYTISEICIKNIVLVKYKLNNDIKHQLLSDDSAISRQASTIQTHAHSTYIRVFSTAKTTKTEHRRRTPREKKVERKTTI